MIDIIEIARKAMEVEHKKQIVSLGDKIQHCQKLIDDFKKQDADNEKLSNAEFGEKYIDQINYHKGKLGL
jgi:predicted transposase YbfD/YdcC